MSTFVYAPSIKSGTRELIEALDAKRLTRFDGLQFVHKGKPIGFTSDDVIICWGACVPPISGIRILNANCSYGTDLQFNKNLDTITLPNQMMRAIALFQASGYEGVGYPEKVDSPIYGTMVPSMDYPGYGSLYIAQSYEYNVHVFDEKVIRMERKIPNPSLRPVPKSSQFVQGSTVHPYIKSRLTGWMLSPEALSDTPNAQEVVIQYIKKLGLNFGVVSIGMSRRDYSKDLLVTLIVRKLTLAPELDGNTLNLYIKAIKNWIVEKK